MIKCTILICQQSHFIANRDFPVLQNTQSTVTGLMKMCVIMDLKMNFSFRVLLGTHKSKSIYFGTCTYLPDSVDEILQFLSCAPVFVNMCQL